MDAFVLDASIALAWCFPDEQSQGAYRALDALHQMRALVPGHWHLELANALLAGWKRHRLSDGEIAKFVALLGDLPIETDLATAAHALRESLQVAAAHHLSAYDAAYLELAMREGLPLATLDAQLVRAAEEASVRLLC